MLVGPCWYSWWVTNMPSELHTIKSCWVEARITAEAVASSWQRLLHKWVGKMHSALVPMETVTHWDSYFTLWCSFWRNVCDQHRNSDVWGVVRWQTLAYAHLISTQKKIFKRSSNQSWLDQPRNYKERLFGFLLLLFFKRSFQTISNAIV